MEKDVESMPRWKRTDKSHSKYTYDIIVLLLILMQQFSALKYSDIVGVLQSQKQVKTVSQIY